jgi:hypothetical protein
LVCHVILALRKFNTQIKEKMKNLREDAYKDKVIKEAEFKKDSDDSDGDDDFGVFYFFDQK